MTKKLRCTISRSQSSYPILIQSGLMADPDELIHEVSLIGSRIAIITTDNIASIYGNSLLLPFSKQGLEAFLFSFSDGEQNKTRHTKEILENQMFEKGLGLDTCVIAIGGGVVTDVGGYLAATYCRGVPLVMVPTSLLCMVDASIGGKNGVDVSYGKNLVGCFYQPKKVFIDPEMLNTLPAKELRNGVVEMIKHGLIADPSHFEFLEANAEALMGLDSDVLEQAIYDSCRIKIDIVQQDEKDVRKRHLLNFGHTIGHAIELLTRYVIPHGEAVAIGLLVECHLSMQRGYLDQLSFHRIRKIFETYGLPFRFPGSIRSQDIVKAMSMDKKSLNGVPRFVMIEHIGVPLTFNSAYCDEVDESILNNALQWMNDDLCRH